MTPPKLAKSKPRASAVIVLCTIIASSVIAGVGCGQGGGTIGTATPTRPANQPNVVYILLDDAGYADLGSYGSTEITTPQIDLIAAEGVRFTNAYSSGAVCSPTRAAFLSGASPAQTGARLAFNSTITFRGLPGSVKTVAETLRLAGYVTGHVGKWHLGLNRTEFRPIAQGFDYSATERSLLADSPGYFDPAITVNESMVFQHPGEHLTEVETDYAINFIRAFADQPFFLNLWYRAPHLPLEPPAQWAALYPDTDQGKYAALMSHVDNQIGRIIFELDRLGLSEDTMVIINSDNGGAKQSHLSNGPWRGFKREMFEGGIRVPLIFRWPGRIASGGQNESVVATADLYPTIADLVGLPIQEVSGESFSAALLGGYTRTLSGPLFWEEKPLAMRVLEGEGGRLYDFAARDERWKLIMERGDVYLFNLFSDPRETANVAFLFPGRVFDLQSRYDAWRIGESRLPLTIESSSPTVSVVGDSMTFNSAGRVNLDANAQFDFHDGDFSAKLSVTPRDPPDEMPEPAEIIRKSGSWRLQLTRGGRIRLRVTGDDRDAELTSVTILDAGQTADVAVTFYGLDGNDSLIRLFINGVIEAEGGVGNVAPSEQPIVLGDNDAARSFIGQVENLQLFNTSLAPFEVTRTLNATVPSPEPQSRRPSSGKATGERAARTLR